MADDVVVRRDLLEHVSRAQLADWMNSWTSCEYIASKHGLEKREVRDEYFRELVSLGFVEEDAQGMYVTQDGYDALETAECDKIGYRPGMR